MKDNKEEAGPRTVSRIHEGLRVLLRLLPIVSIASGIAALTGSISHVAVSGVPVDAKTLKLFLEQYLPLILGVASAALTTSAAAAFLATMTRRREETLPLTRVLQAEFGGAVRSVNYRRETEERRHE